jgi:hypothetical protein
MNSTQKNLSTLSQNATVSLHKYKQKKHIFIPQTHNLVIKHHCSAQQHKAQVISLNTNVTSHLKCEKCSFTQFNCFTSSKIQGAGVLTAMGGDALTSSHAVHQLWKASISCPSDDKTQISPYLITVMLSLP